MILLATEVAEHLTTPEAAVFIVALICAAAVAITLLRRLL